MRTILYIGTFELPDKNAAALRVMGNAKAMQSAGHTVVLVGIEDTDIGKRDCRVCI